MKITEHTGLAERRAHRDLKIALLRSAALHAGVFAGAIRNRPRRLAAARAALEQAAAELAVTSDRNTTWILAMHAHRARQL
jgi:hypothetical protein